MSIDVDADRYSVMGGDGIDGNGHGTRMAEIIREICPEAKLLSIQATNDEGVGSASSLYAAIQLAIELKADVINLSLYGVRSEQNRTLETVIQSAVDAGINVVGAAGNSGRDTSGYIPGSMENVVVVGSVNEDGTLAAFSNFGEFVNYYVVSGSTSEAAATISALTAADGLIVDNQHVYTMYVDSSADVVDGAAPWSARTFIYAFLSDVNAMAKDFDFAQYLNSYSISTVQRMRIPTRASCWLWTYGTRN